MWQFRENNDSSFRYRGYFGVAFLNPKYESNFGVLLRSATIYGASFFATIGEKKYNSMNSDTVKSWKHVPFFHYDSFEDFYRHIPKECQLIGVENNLNARDMNLYIHPERAVYLLGSETNGIDHDTLTRCADVVKINTPLDVCLNVGVSGSIILNDRYAKTKRLCK